MPCPYEWLATKTRFFLSEISLTNWDNFSVVIINLLVRVLRGGDRVADSASRVCCRVFTGGRPPETRFLYLQPKLSAKLSEALPINIFYTFYKNN